MNYIGLSHGWIDVVHAWSQEPRTKIAQRVLGKSWFLVLGSRHELHRLKPNSFGEILIIASWFQA